MKKVLSRLLALALTASLLLTGCGGGAAPEEKENAEASTQKTEQTEEGKKEETKEEAKEEKKGEEQWNYGTFMMQRRNRPDGQ